MSRWKERGFVQDSDEEEDDLDTVSPPPSPSSPATRDAPPLPPPKDSSVSIAQALDEPEDDNYSEPEIVTPAPEIENPIAASAPPESKVEDAPAVARERSESPDPLQAEYEHPKLNTNVQEDSIVAPSIRPEGHIPNLDLSDDDDLSDPPSDLDEQPPAAFNSPRRPTVQVVIPHAPPPSTAPLLDAAPGQTRTFRERKPIQLHPYILEQEKFRQTFQRQGLKPPPRPRSPSRNQHQDYEESQEKDYEPDKGSPSHSQEVPDLSTPQPQTFHSRRRRLSSVGRATSNHASTDMSETRFSHTQPHATYSAGRKRRKLTHVHPPKSTNRQKSLMKLYERYGINTEEPAAPAGDVWEVPPSPPHSSSPMTSLPRSAARAVRPSRLTGEIAGVSLPTPSNSSSIRGDDLLAEDSDSDVIPTSTRPLGRSRPLIESSESSDSEPDTPVNRVSKLGKVLRGVLPASYARYADMAQMRRKEAAQRQARLAMSPQKDGPLRGVARPITKGSASRTAISLPDAGTEQEIITISDGSDTEIETIVAPLSVTHQTSAGGNQQLAALFDSRYPGKGPSDMEDDSLDLFARETGERVVKRKCQSKLTDSFHRTKKPRQDGFSSSSKGPRNSHSAGQTRRATRKDVRPRKPRRPAPPALSVVDVDLGSRRGSPMPQFMRVAARQARRRPDLARQSPTRKHVKLHTVQDTADANAVLEQWRRGALMPKATPRPPAKRAPLIERHTNGQFPAASAMHEERPIARQEHTTSEGFPATLRSGSEKGRIPIVFTRAPSERGSEHQSTAKLKSTQKKLPRKIVPVHPSLRPAQLEGLESEFGRSQRTFRFQRGLQLADNNFSLGLLQRGPALNIPLAKFLADDDEVAPRILPEPDRKSLSEAIQNKDTLPPRTQRRRLRKHRARRIDVDTREYRQPSEPALDAYLSTYTPVQQAEPAPTGEDILEGLGPSGSKYPATFDVHPLDMGTYFHPETFIGSGDLEKALVTPKRDLDKDSGTYTFQCGDVQFKGDSWDDATYSQVLHIFENLNASGEDLQSSGHSVQIVRHLIRYVARNLSFLDPIDRQDFASKMMKLLDTQLSNLSRHLALQSTQPDGALGYHHQITQTLSYLSVLTMQVYQIASHPVVSSSTQAEVQGLVERLFNETINHLLHDGITSLSSFLEKNAIFREREAGIREEEVYVECTIICMHVLDSLNIPRLGFWDIVSKHSSATIEKAIHVKLFDSVWATTYALLPFVELDASGILVRDRRFQLANENWSFIKDLLKRLFELYPATERRNRSVVEYVKATFRRCNVLLENWHWRKCDPVLAAIFDFFAANGLQDIEQDGARDSPAFLQELGDHPRLSLEATDTAFQIFLKCLTSGVRGMRVLYPDKKIRSLVFRCTPNHGRNYPRDKDLTLVDRSALRNHHDLLCTLYWASPPAARPSLSRIRDLVQLDNSHTGACQLSVRAWSNLSMFQFSTDEAYSSLQPLAVWHKEILDKTWDQYRSTKMNADIDLKTAPAEDHGLIKSMMMTSQDKLIELLRDCVTGLREVVARWKNSPFMRNFLIDCDILHLLEFVHADDSRLAVVICETLAVLRDYIAAQLTKPISADVSQPASEESQDYGDFPDLDDLSDAENGPATIRTEPPLDFIQAPLWKLLSNVFGTERSPGEALLRGCVDIWTQIAHTQVSTGDRAWSYYLGSFSAVSWHQLRDTEQTRKYKPYFMASVCERDPSALSEHRNDFLNTLLVSLVERDSRLKFQDRLLLALVQADTSSPLVENLPFYRDELTNKIDINFSTLKERRRALISSILANMQQEMLRIRIESPSQYNEVKSEYAALLQDMMNAMKSNYQQLRQGSTATGAYVDFVQQVVQFLTQYTTDICPVNPFFTDSVNFPLPTSDPTYVVGRLSGYAPKLTVPGATKQLAMFIQTSAQQAAHDNKGDFLLSQLTIALTEDEGSSRTKSALRHVLLQGIFPAYVEQAFSSSIGMIVAKPILQALQSIFTTSFFELRVMEDASVENFCNSTWSISSSFIKATERLKTQPQLIEQPYILRSMSYILDAVASALPTLQYIAARSSPDPQIPDFVRYVYDFVGVVAHVLSNIPPPHSLPTFEAPDLPPSPNADLLSFCIRELQSEIKTHWTESITGISFGHGYAKRDVVVDIGTFEEERSRFLSAFQALDTAIAFTYDPDGDAGRRRHEARVFGEEIATEPMLPPPLGEEMMTEEEGSGFSFGEEDAVKEEPASSFSLSFLNV